MILTRGAGQNTWASPEVRAECKHISGRRECAVGRKLRELLKRVVTSFDRALHEPPK